jgi:hypothetical protein
MMYEHSLFCEPPNDGTHSTRDATPPARLPRALPALTVITGG